MMKKSVLLTLVVAAFLSVSTNTVFAGWDANAEKKARDTIGAFKKTDKGLNAFFDKAAGYAVFPTVGKGAIGIGGAHGKGTVFAKGAAIGSTTLTQVTVGFQLGAQVYIELIFFKDDAALQNFKRGDYELGAQISAVAVTLGASADADYSKGVAVFTIAEGGLMYEAAVGGQKFKYEPIEG